MANCRSKALLLLLSGAVTGTAAADPISKPCELGKWRPWGACDKTCGGGVQERTKHVTAAAVGDGMCDLDILGGRQRRMCHVSPCPKADPQPPITVPSTHAFLRLTGDDDVVAITGDNSTLFTGATKLYRILHDTMTMDGERALAAPYTRITALASDATYIYVAVEVFGASPGQFAIQKIIKDKMLEDGALVGTCNTVKAAVIRIVQDNTFLYVSLNQNDHATLVAIAKASMDIVAIGHLQNHGKAHALLHSEAGHKHAELVFGTWDGTVGILRTDDLLAMSPGSTANFIPAAAIVGQSTVGRRKFVNVVETKFAYFFASDEPSGGGVTKFTKASLLLQRSGRLQSVVFSHGDLQAAGDKCTSLAADWIRLYCGTNTGKVEVLSSQTLERALDTTDMASVDPGSSVTPSFYASVALGSHLYLVSYGATIYKLQGFMAQQDCELSAWENWGSKCLDLSQRNHRREVACGPGYKVRRRKIIRHPLWGGAACGDIEDFAACVAQDAAGNELECCTGGKVRTTQRQNVICSAGHAGFLGAPTNTTSGCYCPAENPVELTGVGSAASMCGSIEKKCGDVSNATVCKHINCVSQSHSTGDTVHIMVRHTNVHKEFNWGAPHNDHEKRERKNLHKCSLSHGRLGGCVCMCWHEPNAIPEWWELVRPKPTFRRKSPPTPAPPPVPAPSPPTGWFR